MATKPSTSPRLWGTNALYTTGPFIGQPGKVDPGVGVAAEGHRPGAAFPTPAEFENYQQNRVTDWVTNWLRLGNSAAALDAHVQETDSLGSAGMAHAFVKQPDGGTFTESLLVEAPPGDNKLAARLRSDRSAATVLIQNSGSGPGMSCTAVANIAAAFAGGDGTAASGAFTSVGFGASPGGIVQGGPSGAYGLIGKETGGGFGGLRGEGPTRGVHGVATSTSGSGVRGETAAGALAGTPGVLGVAQNLGTGGAFFGTNGPGATASASGAGNGLEASAVGNVSANAALRLTMQAGVFTGSELVFTGRGGDSTSTGAGRMNLNTVTGTITVSDVNVGEQKDTHASRGGLAMGPGTQPGIVTNNNTVLYTLATTLTLTGLCAPRRAGVKVTLVFTCDVRTPSATSNGILDVQIYDFTAGVPVVTKSGSGGGPNAGYLLPFGTASWQRSVTLPFEYTIPAAGDRTITALIKTSTGFSVEVRNASIVPHGAYT